MKRTKIVATIGPASQNSEMLEKLVIAGIDVMRLNFSHGDHEEQLGKIKTLRRINEKLGTSVAFLLDTKGPEIRTRVFADDSIHEFFEGNKITITTRNVDCTDTLLSVTYEKLTEDVSVGSHILIDDGLIDVVVDKIEGTEIECTIQNNGKLKSKRGVNVPGAKLQFSALTNQDKIDIAFGVKENLDFVAASFVRKAKDIIEIREFLKSLGNDRMKIIAKIENQEGIDNFEEILEVSDGIMVARGDLGVEVPIERLPSLQKMMIRKTVDAGKPVITATQMLDSMQKNPRPTRAEVSDVANAVYDGTSAVMLSGESAQGDYPLESVTTMAKIVVESEKNIDYWRRFKKRNLEKLTSFDDQSKITDVNEFKKQANFAVCCSAMFSNAEAIIAVSDKGVTPSFLSSYKPECPIYVITANENTCRQMSVNNGIVAVYVPNEYDFDKILNEGIEILKAKKLLKDNDTVVLSGGFPNDKHTDFLTTQATGTILKI